MVILKDFPYKSAWSLGWCHSSWPLYLAPCPFIIMRVSSWPKNPPNPRMREIGRPWRKPRSGAPMAPVTVACGSSSLESDLKNPRRWYPGHVNPMSMWKIPFWKKTSPPFFCKSNIEETLFYICFWKVSNQFLQSIWFTWQLDLCRSLPLQHSEGGWSMKWWIFFQNFDLRSLE